MPFCKEYEYRFIDSDSIKTRDLWEDGLYLLELGKTKLAQNFIYFFNNF